jgi:hypothetical protein
MHTYCVFTLFLAGELPKLRSYKVYYIYIYTVMANPNTGVQCTVVLLMDKTHRADATRSMSHSAFPRDCLYL